MTLNYYPKNGHSGASPGATAMGSSWRQRHVSTRLSSPCVWVNGELVPVEDTSAQVLNPALHYGPGALEEIRCYQTRRGPAVFRLEDHLQRFLQATRALGVNDLRYTLLDLRRAVHVTVQVNNFSDCTVRPALYFEPGLEPHTETYHPTIAIVAGDWHDRDDDALKGQGVSAIVSSFDQVQANVETGRGNFDGQLASAITGRSLARDAGVDVAILLDPHGYVAGCAGQALFTVYDGVAYTPPQAAALTDVARNTALTLLQDSGVRVVEDARLTRERLHAADELFLCSVASEVVPVRTIDGRDVGDGQSGPVARSLQQLYADTARGHGRRSRGWLEYVMMEPLF
ncbi:MAG: aminotransferase class IV [Chloroflexota bacterium]